VREVPILTEETGLALFAVAVGIFGR